MMGIIRRGGYPNGHAWIGISKAPYEDWAWRDSGCHLGGPNFLVLPDSSMWASGRVLERDSDGEIMEKTALAKITLDGVEKVLDLPSGGEDTSYPGMVYQEGGILWISYYSSHENGKTAIYLAKVKVP